MVRAGQRFDIVFADPPYGQSSVFDALQGISALLADGGTLVLQVDAKTPPPALPGLALVQKRAYGRNVFLFFGML
jgi:16S rRNA (guanine966-N2)-methyltransferase